MIAICNRINHRGDLAQPAFEPVVIGETNAGALVVARRIDPKPGSETRAIIDRNHENVRKLWNMHSKHISTTNVTVASVSVVGTARVELRAAFANSPRFDLDPEKPAVRWDDGAEVKRQPSTEWHKHVYPDRDKSLKHGSFGRISAMNRVHASTIITPSDRTHVRVRER